MGLEKSPSREGKFPKRLRQFPSREGRAVLTLSLLSWHAWPLAVLGLDCVADTVPHLNFPRPPFSSLAYRTSVVPLAFRTFVRQPPLRAPLLMLSLSAASPLFLPWYGLAPSYKVFKVTGLEFHRYLSPLDSSDLSTSIWSGALLTSVPAPQL